MSYLFDAAGEYMSGAITTALAKDSSNALTIGAWVKKTDWDAASDSGIAIASEVELGQNPGFALYTAAADAIKAWARGTGSTYPEYTFTATAYDAKWVFVAVTGGSDVLMDVFIENSTNTTSDTTSAIAAALGWITLGSGGSSTPFNGWVAEVCIWNIELSATDIDALQTAEGTGPNPSSIQSANVIGYWPLNKDYGTGAGAVVNEATGAAADATGDLTATSGATYAADHPTITGVIDSVSFESDGVTDISDTHGLTLVANDVVVCCISNNKATNDFVINDDNAGAFIPITARVQGSTFAHRCFYYIVPSKNPLTVFNFDMNSYSGRMSRTYIQVRGAYLPDLISSALTTETPSASLMPQANDTDRNNTLMLAFCTDDSISTAGDDITGWDSFAEVIEANGAAGQIQAAASYNQVEKGTPPTDTIVQSVIWTVVGINSIGKDVKPTAVPLVITLPTTIPRAMLLDDLTPDYFEATIVPVATTPISMAAWTYPDDNINNDFCVMQIQDSAIGSEYIRFGISHSGDPEGVNKRVSGFWNNSGTLAQVVSTAETTYNAWNHFGIALDVNDQAAYLNGGSKGTNTNTLGALTGLDSISVGREGDSTFGDDWSGGLLWPAIWNAILTDEEFALLAGGIPPWMIRPDALRFCARLDGSNDGLRDIVSGQVLTITGTPELMQAPLNKLQLPQKKIFMGQPDFTKQNLVVLP